MNMDKDAKKKSETVSEILNVICQTIKNINITTEGGKRK